MRMPCVRLLFAALLLLVMPAHAAEKKADASKKDDAPATKVDKRSAAEKPVYVGTDDKGVITFTDSPRAGSDYSVFIEAFGSEILSAGGRSAKDVYRNIDTYDRYILAAAEAYKISPSLLKAVILVESGFNPRAGSPAGAQGLCQLMPDTAKWLGVADPMNADMNIRGGAKFLSMLHKEFADTSLVLAAYHAGPGRVRKAGGIPNIQATKDYVVKVQRFHRYFTLQRPVTRP